MNRLNLAILATMLLLTPSASAWPWDNELVVRPAQMRGGDRMLYDTVEPGFEMGPDDEFIPTTWYRQMIVEIKGPSTATDRYGIERATILTQIDEREDGELIDSYLCHQLAGGSSTVRRDFLMPAQRETDASSSLLGGSARTTRDSNSVTSFSGSCQVSPLSREEFRENEKLPLELLLGEDAPAEVLAQVSEPAVAIDFSGHAALLIVYDIQKLLAAMEGDEETEDVRGTIEFVIADALPAPASVKMDIRSETDPDEVTFISSILAGFDAGTGPLVPAAGTDELPERNPAATWTTPDPRILDAAAFNLDFPYMEAYASLMSDPRWGLGEWFSAHPEAILARAYYFAEASTTDRGVEDPDGTWMITFSDETESIGFTIQRTRGIKTAIAPIASPLPVTVSFSDADTDAIPAYPPTELPGGAALAAIAAANGIAVGNVKFLALVLYESPTRPGGVLMVSEVASFAENHEGNGIWLDLTTGGALGVWSEKIETERTGLIPIVSPEKSVTPASSAQASLSTPSSIATTGAAVATGAGLLGLILKFLVAPLFTRLRRDRLLDNPVRARLYERIRAEPGIHRAELVDFAGIGEGATRHHLTQLAKHRLVVELEQEGFVRYFAAGEVPPDVARRESTLRAGSQRAVYELYATEPSLSLRAAGARLGMSAPSIHRAKKKLEKAGLLPAAPSVSVAEV